MEHEVTDMTTPLEALVTHDGPIVDGSNAAVSEEIIEYFAEYAGLTRERIEASYSNAYTGSLDKFKAKVTALEAYEGLNVPRAIHKLPSVMGQSSNAIAERVQMFDGLGLDAISLINRKPQILSLAPATVADRYAALAKRGLDANKIVQFIPGVLTVTDTKIDAVMDFLAAKGADPQHAINAVPALLPLSLDQESPTSLPSKVRNLEQLGLDAGAIIAKYPKILTCSQEGIQEKFTVLQNIVQGLNPELSVHDVIAKQPIALSRAAESLWASAQVAMADSDRPKDTVDDISGIVNRSADRHVRIMLDDSRRAESMADLLCDPEVRKQLGAFTVLACRTKLSGEQKQLLDTSIHEKGDISRLSLVAVQTA